MCVDPDIAAIAALEGNPSRAAMLSVLMDGRAHTATELSVRKHRTQRSRRAR